MASNSQTSFSEMLEQIENKNVPDEKFRKTKSIARAAGKGLIKAATNIQEINPLAPRGPLTVQQQRAALEKLMGAPEEGFSERLTERFAENVPMLLGGPGKILTKVGRAVLTSLLGQTAEEMGASPLGQSATEISALGLPGLGKKIIPKKNQQELIAFLRNKGIKEKFISPLLASKKKASFVKTFGKKTSKTEEFAKEGKEVVGEIFNEIGEQYKNKPILASSYASSLESDLRNKLLKVDTELRGPIEKEIADVFSRPVKGDDLMRLWRFVNKKIYEKGGAIYKKQLNILKDDIYQSMKDISPNLAKEFSLANNAYTKVKQNLKVLTPTQIEQWGNLGKLGGAAKIIVNSIIHGTSPIKALIKFGGTITGVEGARKLVTQMMINPRLQNLSKQMVHALKNHQLPIAAKIQKKIDEELEENVLKSVSKNPKVKNKPQEK